MEILYHKRYTIEIYSVYLPQKLFVSGKPVKKKKDAVFTTSFFYIKVTQIFVMCFPDQISLSSTA